MLSKILSKSDCASCKFCCSFRRQSLWESPIFEKEKMEKLKKLYPDVKFKNQGKFSFTFDISDKYKTDDSEEEAPCPFLDSKKGCKLPPDLKPFDCSIWPLRAVRIPSSATFPYKEQELSSNSQSLKISPQEKASSKIRLALTPTCPAINKLPFEQIQEVLNSGLGEKILLEAKKNPDMVKEYSDFFKLL